MGLAQALAKGLASPRLSIITGLDYWTEQLEWTTGLTFFALKIIFMAYNEIPLPVKLHPALGQSVIVSSIALHRTTHIS